MTRITWLCMRTGSSPMAWESRLSVSARPASPPDPSSITDRRNHVKAERSRSRASRSTMEELEDQNERDVISLFIIHHGT